MKYAIVQTSNGFMVDDGQNGYIHTPNGDNCFDTYNEAQLALAQHLINNAIGGL